MPRFDASSARCHIFTFREGPLSPLAHDLRIKVSRFTIDVSDYGPSIEAVFDSASLRVEFALREGAERPDILSEKDMKEIDERTIHDVLQADRYPEIRFLSSSISQGDSHLMVTGTLSLHGRTRELSFPVGREKGWWLAEVKIHQPDFGIRPFRAFLGAMRIKPDIVVRIAIPDDRILNLAAGPDTEKSQV